MAVRNVNTVRRSLIGGVVATFRLLPRLLGRALGASSDSIAERNQKLIQMIIIII